MHYCYVYFRLLLTVRYYGTQWALTQKALGDVIKYLEVPPDMVKPEFVSQFIPTIDFLREKNNKEEGKYFE